MSLELEDEVGGVDEKEHDSSPTGDDKKTRLTAFLDGARLADLRVQIKSGISTGLRPEICSGDYKRFFYCENQKKR